LSHRNEWDPAQHQRRRIAQIKRKLRTLERQADREGVDIVPHLTHCVQAIELTLRGDT
jgi:hypothetical protein